VPLGEAAQALDVDASFRAGFGPKEVGFVHENWTGVPRLWILQLLATRALPDRLIGVQVALSLNIFVSPEHTVLEAADLLQLRHSLKDFGTGEITLPARASELQNNRQSLVILSLRAVIGSLGEIPHHAGLHGAISPKLEFTLKLESKLFEVVSVTRRQEILVAPAHGQLEVVDVTSFALKQVPVMKNSAAM
jgi:hypothetical protein